MSLKSLPPTVSRRIRQLQILGNEGIFRFVAWAVLGQVALLAILASPWVNALTHMLDILWFSMTGLWVSSIVILGMRRWAPALMRTCNTPYTVCTVIMTLLITALGIRDHALASDNSAFLLGTLVLGMVYSGPYQVYPILIASALGLLWAGVAVVAPGKPNVEHISTWLSYAVIALGVSWLLERKRRESYQYRILLEESNENLRQISFRDPLTGVYNRRFFDEVFSQQVGVAGRKGHTLSLISFDLDHFKRVNDSFGHPKGDEVLVHTAALVTHTLRQNDILARVGGEEFMVLLLDTPLEAAKQVAERIRRLREQSTAEGLGHPVTMSLGVVEYRKDESREAMVDRADQALYRAKHQGRNRVETG